MQYKVYIKQQFLIDYKHIYLAIHFASVSSWSAQQKLIEHEDNLNIPVVIVLVRPIMERSVLMKYCSCQEGHY
jgi:hypothetical protein